MATEIKYKDTSFKYVMGEKNVLFSNGVLFSIDEFTELDRSGKLFKKLLEKQSKGIDTGYNYAYAVKHDQLKKVNRKVVTEVEPAKKDIEAKGTTAQNERIGILEVVMYFVTSGGVVMSTINTFSFLLLSYSSAATAFITSVTMVLFSSTSFTASRKFMEKRGASLFYALLFLFLGVCVVAYSMFSTVAVNYTKFMTVQEANLTASVAKPIIAEKDERKSRITAEITSLENRIAEKKSEADYWRDKTWRRYDAIIFDMGSLEKMRDSLFSELNTIEKEVVKQIEVEKGESKDVYDFVSGILSVEKRFLQFVIYTIPASFFDIVAPFGLTVVFLLREQRKSKGKKDEKNA